MRRYYTKLNRHIHFYRIGVEHAFAELKQLKNIISHATVTPLTASDNIIAGLVCRKKLEGLNL